MKQVNKFFIIIFFASLSKVSFSQENNLTFTLRSVRADFTYFVFITDITALTNIELYKNERASLGIEPSVDYLFSGSPGGPTPGSPFLDYNLPAYLHLNIGKPLNFKMTVGFCYRTANGEEGKDYPDSQFRIGFAIYWDFLKYFGIHLKFNHAMHSKKESIGPTGIGISVNVTQ